MSKYKLINIKTKEEHLCDKVTIDGFDYYVSEEVIEKGWKGIAYKEDVTSKIFKHFYTTNEWYKDAKKVIATNNPNIDIPKVVDKVEILADNYFNSDYAWIKNVKAPYSDTDVELIKNNYKEGYNKSQETYSFSEEDIIAFLNWVRDNCVFDSAPKPYYRKTQERLTQQELLQIWKKQQPKTIYYNTDTKNNG